MKKTKLLPAPNLELRLYVTYKMVEDMKECTCLAKVPDGPGKDCETCSWNDVSILGVRLCAFEDVCRKVLEEKKEKEKVMPPAPASWRYHMERRFQKRT